MRKRKGQSEKNSQKTTADIQQTLGFQGSSTCIAENKDLANPTILNEQPDAIVIDVDEDNDKSYTEKGSSSKSIEEDNGLTDNNSEDVAPFSQVCRITVLFFISEAFTEEKTETFCSSSLRGQIER